MNSTILYTGVSIAVIAVLTSLIASIIMIRKQQDHEIDDGMNRASVKHYILLNPAIIAIIVFPIAVAFGAYLLYIYLY